MVFVYAVFAQQQDEKPGKKSGYVINGTLKGEYKGKVYLVREEAWHGKQTLLDSCEVVNGKYQFKGGEVSTVMLHFIKSKDGQLTPVFLENGVINIVADPKSFLWGTVTGTPNNDLRDLYKMQVRYIQDSVTKTTVVDWSIYGRDAVKEEKEFVRRTKWIGTRWLQIQEAMVQKYSEQVFAPFLMLSEMVADEPLARLKELRAGLAPELANHPYTKALDDFIAAQSFGVGVQAYDFTLPTIDGKEISLKDYAGKYVFLDFWASWCGPCRREIPYVTKLYKKYQGKNFEIIGISVDRDEQKWKEAVKEHNMKWTQCCDFQEWNSVVCNKYNVQAIPRTVLIDPNGKVIAVDLRGEKLLEEVGKFLKK